MGRANVRQPRRIGPDQSLTAGRPEPNDVQAESRLTAWTGRIASDAQRCAFRPRTGEVEPRQGSDQDHNLTIP
jgi:hypothetical protein